MHRHINIHRGRERSESENRRKKRERTAMEEGIAPPSRRPWGVVVGVVARRRGARVGGEEPSRSTTAEGPIAVRTVTAVVFRHRCHVVTPSSPPKALALPLLLWPPSSVACAKGERSLENKERSHVRLVPRGRGLFSRHRCCHDHRCSFKKKGGCRRSTSDMVAKLFQKIQEKCVVMQMKLKALLRRGKLLYPVQNLQILFGL
ncbi:uncharacterized protein LOC107641976 isoform X1 [Arachis ipaensis]|uniref:uncharacterized protein LOC107641976 isoform X1 n=1 Tax=Arachis ipaensis TaxID=130454 RepID=UPI000A2B3204|nr:uncharacterized protein LOC107641976 isoform X1 [Arachis ipaensis]XP_025655078.1 uncharacterized protein LOC112750527 isoform X1 [Arachis hypogaea]